MNLGHYGFTVDPASPHAHEIEDLGFGFGLVTLTLVLWTRLGRTAAEPVRQETT